MIQHRRPAAALAGARFFFTQLKWIGDGQTFDEVQRRHLERTLERFAGDIEAEAEHARDEFELGVALAVLALAGVCRDRFAAIARRFATGVEFLEQRRREALVVGSRFAVDDQAEDAIGMTEPFVSEDLLVGPVRVRSRGRADDDEACRIT